MSFKYLYTYSRIVILKYSVISVNNNYLKLVFYIWTKNTELISFGYVMQIFFSEAKKTKWDLI